MVIEPQLQGLHQLAEEVSLCFFAPPTAAGSRKTLTADHVIGVFTGITRLFNDVLQFFHASLQIFLRVEVARVLPRLSHQHVSISSINSEVARTE